jgi:acyl-homoserine lactone acylase PvdQ
MQDVLRTICSLFIILLPLFSNLIVVCRSLYDMGSEDRSYSVFPPGISERPGSPHYTSMIPLWQRCEMGKVDWKVPASKESNSAVGKGGEL